MGGGSERGGEQAGPGGTRPEGSRLLSSTRHAGADWLPGRWEGLLSAGMTLYLAISVAPMAIAFRAQLEK